jgi:hypothetical protein
MSKVKTLYFIHHSHTDIGYTHDQPIVWELHERFIDEALACADRMADSNSDGAFRWTVETTGVFYRWLQHAAPADVGRLVALERAGRIEMTGMLANITPLYDLDQLIESFQLLRLLRQDYGFTIRYAMNCDVNGQNWPLVETLLDAGIEGFSMAINNHFGGAPFQRPNAFWWAGPSGRTILAWNGWTYDTGWRFGLGRDSDAFEKVWWPRIEQRLADIDYPLSSLMVQSYHPFGDNGPAFANFSRFIDDWNAAGKTPHLCFATPRMWWAAVKEEAQLLPTYQGDWTDYWNFGCISSAREQTLNRASRLRLRSADAAAAAALAGAEPTTTGALTRALKRYRETAWHNLHFWDEHTWGADISLRLPDSEDTAAQWYHKAQYAYNARSLSLLLQRDALAALAQQVSRTAPTDLLVFNPLPWPRTIAGEVSPALTSPRGTADDATAGRHFQDRVPDADPLVAAAATADGALPELSHGASFFILKPREVPGFGYAVIPRSELVELKGAVMMSEAAIIENDRFRLEFDRGQGGIRSWYDKQLAYEWVEREAGYPFNGYVHEEVSDHGHPWPRRLLFDMVWDAETVERPTGWKTGWRANRRQPTTVVSHRVYQTPLGLRVIQQLEAPGCVGLLSQSVFLPNFAGYIECEAWWQMGLTVHPEATYLLYPFNLPQATARLDLGGQSLIPGQEQLPGVCRDYFTTQQWVDFSNGDYGVTIATPDNPMVQLGDFHFGHYQADFKLERAMLLGWVTNNYWETNFRPHQPGEVRARYRLQPYQGLFDEARAHRFGLEAAQAKPLLQHLGEPPANLARFSQTGALLHLPGHDGAASAILTLHVKPAAAGDGLIVRLYNAGDEAQTARIASAQLQIAAARRCDLFETPLEELAVDNGVVAFDLAPRRVGAVWIGVR